MSGDDIEMDLNQIENELIVQLSDNHSGGLVGAHLGSSAGLAQSSNTVGQLAQASS